MEDGYDIDVYLRDTRDGYIRVISDTGYPSIDGDPFSAFIWSEGNYLCDCNRSLFLYDDEDKKLPCGEGTIVIDKIVKCDTGEILYREDT